LRFLWLHNLFAFPVLFINLLWIWLNLLYWKNCSLHNVMSR
jgi:hypothetical protein